VRDGGIFTKTALDRRSSVTGKKQWSPWLGGTQGAVAIKRIDLRLQLGRDSVLNLGKVINQFSYGGFLYAFLQIR
jgi:hypothetical protein